MSAEFRGVGFTKRWAVHGVAVDPVGLVELVKVRAVMVARFVVPAWSETDGWWMGMLPGSGVDGVWARLVVVNDSETAAAEITNPDVDPGTIMADTVSAVGVVPVGVLG